LRNGASSALMEGDRDNAAKSAKKLKRPECDVEDEDWPLPPHQGRTFKTVEMHAGGEPLRIFRLKDPRLVDCTTLLSKRRYIRDNLDHIRRRLMFEPRGHHEMYGAILVEPDKDEKSQESVADIAVLFIHNEGYSTMCGHAVICLGRFAVDYGLVKSPSSPETRVDIQCPCGVVRAFVDYDGKKTGKVRFLSVPAFVFALDVEIEVPQFGKKVRVDVSYGGAFYAFLPAKHLGLDIRTASMKSLVAAASAVTEAVKLVLTPKHPVDDDLSFLYGTILTCDDDEWRSDAPPAVNCTIFADEEIDRSPTGSGVTARVALQVAKGQVPLKKKRTFEAAGTWSRFTGVAVEKLDYHGHSAVTVEVEGHSFYSGISTFTYESDDSFKDGFLVK